MPKSEEKKMNMLYSLFGHLIDHNVRNVCPLAYSDYDTIIIIIHRFDRNH